LTVKTLSCNLNNPKTKAEYRNTKRFWSEGTIWI